VLAPWCNWLTRGPFKAESPGSSPGGATKTFQFSDVTPILGRGGAAHSRKPRLVRDKEEHRDGDAQKDNSTNESQRHAVGKFQSSLGAVERYGRAASEVTTPCGTRTRMRWRRPGLGSVTSKCDGTCAEGLVFPVARGKAITIGGDDLPIEVDGVMTPRNGSEVEFVEVGNSCGEHAEL
jgi:hypothetical protein